MREYGSEIQARRWTVYGIMLKLVQSFGALAGCFDTDVSQLHIASTVLLQGAEADLVRDRTTLGNGYWVTGLDVFHQVHCIVCSVHEIGSSVYRADSCLESSTKSPLSGILSSLPEQSSTQASLG